MKTNYFKAVAALGVVVALIACQKASAELIVQSSGNYQLVLSDPVPVGSTEGLVKSILSVRYNGAGEGAVWPNGFSGTIAANGSLHHEQFPPIPPFVPTQTPTATLASLSGLDGSVDSHFLQPARVTVTAPMEPLVAGASSSEPGSFSGVTGFGGPLSAAVSYFDANNPPTSNLLDIAQLVFKPTSMVDFNFQVGTGTIGVGATFQGSFIIPEPATLSLIGLAMIGIAGVRRRRS